MAELGNPLADPTPDEIKKLFHQGSYTQLNGVRRKVNIIAGTAVAVEHGLGFKPNVEELTLRTHVAMADVGTVYMTKEPDEKYVYVTAPRTGAIYLEVSHPPKGSKNTP